MLYRLLSRLGAEKYLSSSYFSSWLILAIDTVVSVFSTFVAYLLIRGLFPHPVFTVWYGVWLLAGSCVLSVITFILFRTFRSVIRHTTFREVWKLGAAVLLKDVLMFVYVQLFPQSPLPPQTAIALGFMLDAGHAFPFAGPSSGDDHLLRPAETQPHTPCELPSGSGLRDGGQIGLARYASPELAPLPGHRVSDLRKRLKNHAIADRPVYYFEDESSIEYLRDRVDIDAILFATNDDAQSEQERLIKYCTEKSVKILITPPIDEVIDGKIMKQSIREIKIEDLLGRPEIKISMEEIVANFKDKTIFVTGAAGSIGSELCRQLATFGVKELILFDNGETPMHNLRLELEERYPALKFIPVIGDVRIPARLDFVFRTYHPQVVFHAAAYKHVPLMEENPCEAVLVNVAGTRNVADKCIEYDVEKMVMISTDKAVNPTNVMGCTKRLAEIYVQSLGLSIEQGRTPGKTRFVTTRFGNVLGSNGSVIPRFRDQISKGGPVTVTHPDITRFFMTIPEACRLVMEAATMSTGNQIFVFDMGESVKIAHLARRMISLAGFEPEKDIRIEYTGLRPGEKLYEEVLSNKENTEPTLHDRIRIAKVREYDYREACEVAEELETLSRKVEIPDMVRLMKKTVPEFKSKNSRFEVYDK